MFSEIVKSEIVYCSDKGLPEETTDNLLDGTVVPIPTLDPEPTKAAPPET